MKPRSLTVRLLTIVLGFSFLFTAISAVTGFFAFRAAFIHSALDNLTLQAGERARTQAFVLDTLRQQTQSASILLQRKLAQMPDATVDADFAAYFPIDSDGIGRSAPELFSGRDTPGGDRIYGFGGFQPQAARMSHAEKKMVLAAMAVSRQIGEAKATTNDTFGFTTPHGGLVVFAPKAEDKLVSVRGQAARDRAGVLSQIPANGPAGNPTREMTCHQMDIGRAPGGPRPILRMCMAPAYLGDSYVGVWGSILGDQTNGSKSGRAGAEDLTVSPEGVVVGVFNGQSGTQPTPELIAHYEQLIGLRATMAGIRAENADHGVARSQDGRILLAYAKVRGASWYLVDLAPVGPIEQRAALSALAIVGAGLVAMMGSGALIFWFARRLIVVPLERLARRGDDERTGDDRTGDERTGDDLADLEARPDEIGALARRLSGERVRNDQLLATLEERVAERTEDLERANKAKSSFLANMSHELRTPLNGVVAVSTLLEAQLASPKEKHMASLVASSARLLETVLTDILDVSKIEAGEMTLSSEPFDLTAVADRIGELHRASATAKGLSLNWSIAPEAAGGYLGDEVRVTQILSNLLSNSVKFTQTGEVSLSAEASDEGLRLTVRDTGIGFSPQAAARLFQPFEQADATITRRFGGTGLGLSICAALSAQMGGTIQATSTEGQGSTFVVTLPLPRAEIGARSAEAAWPVANDQPDDKPVRVLLAEDHPTNQQVVALILESLGVDLTIVEDGQQAVDAFKAGAFDIVLMDMQMPVMDGLTAIGQIRAHEAGTGQPRTPIAALTANAMPEHVEASRDAGADHHLSKPIRPDALIRLVQESLAQPPEAPDEPTEELGATEFQRG